MAENLLAEITRIYEDLYKNSGIIIQCHINYYRYDSIQFAVRLKTNVYTNIILQVGKAIDVEDVNSLGDINRNVIANLVEDLQEPLPHGLNIQRRGVREKNRNYYEEIIPMYNGYVFKEHFRMSRRAIEYVKSIMLGKIKLDYRVKLLVKIILIFDINTVAGVKNYNW